MRSRTDFVDNRMQGSVFLEVPRGTSGSTTHYRCRRSNDSRLDVDCQLSANASVSRRGLLST